MVAIRTVRLTRVAYTGVFCSLDGALMSTLAVQRVQFRLGTTTQLLRLIGARPLQGHKPRRCRKLRSLQTRPSTASGGAAQLTVSPRTPGPGPAGDGRLISKNRPQEHFASHHRALAGTDTQIGAK